jgi:DNA polymerase V
LWGINDASAKRLHQVGIHTAGELAEQSDSWLRSELSINAVRVAMELRGVPCHQLDAAPRQQKSVASTRSFGRPLIALDKLEEATASYAARAAEKLRRNKQVAGALQVFVHTNQHKKSDPQYSNAVTVQLEQPTNNTTVLITKAREATRRVFRQGYKYKKSGVILLDLSPQQHRQTDLFSGGEEQLDKKEHLMELVDSLNAKLGRHHVRVASTGLRREWSMRSEHRTPSYTTNWNDLPRAV